MKLYNINGKARTITKKYIINKRSKLKLLKLLKNQTANMV